MYASAMRASVIVPSFNSRKTIERCLASLERQNRRDWFEILVADSSTDGTDRIIASQFPDVQLFRFGERKLPGEARNYAAGRASGDILVFLDADCAVEPDWIEEIIGAHDGRHAAIGGAICNGNPESPTAVAHYLFEFSRWLPTAPPHEQDEIPGGCLSIQRGAFERHGPFPETTYSEDTVLSWRLRAAGLHLLFIPSISVFHLHTLAAPELLRVKAYHGRCFAWQRSRGWHRWKRWAFGVFSVALPVLLIYRIHRRVRGTSLHAAFWKVSPLIGMLAIAWSWGELRGYLSNRQPLP
jgi:GT2 family glycosyltransferase